MWKYTRALDKGDGATYASTYTTDGQFGAGERATKGREALSKLVVRQPAAGEPARPPLYHMELNHWIEFVDKDHARYHAYYLTVSGAMGATCRRGSWQPARASTRWSASTASGC